MSFEELGMFSEGFVAAKINGRWGVIDKNTKWLIEAKYDDVIRDELGRSYGQGVVFVKNGEAIHLISNNNEDFGQFEDAKPFAREGFAAVKRNGLWGFIDNTGNVMIDFLFEDAHSFEQHLAAVKTGDYWGYINKNGKIVIEPIFYKAKSFTGGSAPVLTERGWDFITLIEYR
jgi:hypothetical protein